MIRKEVGIIQERLERRGQQDLRRTVSRTQADGRSADEDTPRISADRAAQFLHQRVSLKPEQQRAAAPANGG